MSVAHDERVKPPCRNGVLRFSIEGRYEVVARMKLEMKKIITAVLIVLFLGHSPFSQEVQKAGEKKQFIYVLKLIPRLLDEKNWTEKDGQIVGRHFRRLKQLHKEGKVILAGRTLNETEPSQMGLVILAVDSEAEAKAIMENDDAVKEKIMTAQLFPFSVALIK
ncbi:MAG: YciI family protein [Pyrinomonadaceae bacterium]